jgi:uncharacterized membrane protein
LGKPLILVRVAFIWIIIQIIQVVQIIQLLWTILHGGSFFDDLHRHGSRCRCRGWDDVPFIVIILILIVVILSHVVASILFSHLHDQLITGLDNSSQGGLLLLWLLSVFPQPLAQGLQLCDLLA